MVDDSSQFKMLAKDFIHDCKSKFGWSSLSEDTVMDVGCGDKGVCGKAVKEYFPDVKQIVFIDKGLPIIHRLRLNCEIIKPRITVADIEKRATIHDFDGEIDKVVSTHAFHQMENKEEAFRNVYRLLKPGGEAAILFVTKSLIHEWLTEFLKIPKWKALYKGHHNADMYNIENATVYYREMVERIGFRVVECSEKLEEVPYETDEACKDAVVKMSEHAFRLTLESVHEFKDESFQVLENQNPRDELGRMCYKATHLSLLLVKPE